MTCRFNGRTNPRTITGRHNDDCTDDTCRGCQPCTEPHCRICVVTHVDGTCAECMAETREALHDLARMCDALPEEVEHRGVEGEAMMLLGPVADPEAWGHMEASVAAGRVPADYLAEVIGDTHPVWVLGNWDMRWRDALEHDEPTEKLSLAETVEYLDANLTYMGAFEHLAFEDFARDVRRSRATVQAATHDGIQIERGAPCMSCGGSLERPASDRKDCRHTTPAREWLATLLTYPELPVMTLEIVAARTPCGGCNQGGSGDGWQCKRCHRTSTEEQYRFAVMHLAREEATHLTDRDMEIRTGVRAGTVRVWARRGLVERRQESGRTVYAVADVEARVCGESAS